MASHAVNLLELESVMHHVLLERWTSRLNVLPNGEAGWYRRFDRSDRVGTFASAQGLISLARLGVEIGNESAVVRTLVKRQRADGAWSFVSTLNNQGVVDATAWAILALAGARKPMSSVITAGADWLIGVALSDGGWGICAQAPFRAYSTALALEALYAAGRSGTDVFRLAVQKLISAADSITGAWRDSTGKLSLAATARVIISLALAGGGELFQMEIRRATNWIRQLYRSEDSWTYGAYVDPHEEVEVGQGAALIRIEYKFTPQALAVSALSRSGFALTPEVVGAVSALISKIKAESQMFPAANVIEPLTSWRLHDLTVALADFRERSQREGVNFWANSRRVVVHGINESRITIYAKRYYPQGIGLAGGFVLIAALSVMGVSGRIAALLSLAGALVLGMATNALYDLVKAIVGRSRQ